ncbi:MAG: ADP-glyceromanno-heptose 6-epimerase [Endomicrobiia bacterium]
MKPIIIVTGGAGFIGSAIIWRLNKEKIYNIVVVDEIDNNKWKNLRGLRFIDYIEKDDFLKKILNGEYDKTEIDTIFHMGACSSTVCSNPECYIKNNFEYSKILCEYAINKNIRFIYASSAATYGDGSNGFSDDENTLETLKPLNLYGYSKHLFDLWAKNKGFLRKIVGLKYFNVFGPNEYHKKDMRSFVIKAFEQIKETGKVRLFKSYMSEYKDGEQLRDFIYIKDAVEMTLFFYKNKNLSGIYNIGTGTPHSFNQLVLAVFKALDIKPAIEYIEMPKEIINQYQYYTKADIKKIISCGYNKKFTDFEASIKEYVIKYISKNKFLADYED